MQGTPYDVSSNSLFEELSNRLSIAFSLLLISVAIVPGLVILDGLVAQSLIAVLAATALAFVGISARAADVNFAAQVTRRLKLAAAVPAIWMVLQILPMPFSRMSHSIWINANEALDRDWWGHISIDIGTTIGALAFYLANIALIVVTVFAARDRRRAEIALFALTAVTTLDDDCVADQQDRTGRGRVCQRDERDTGRHQLVGHHIIADDRRARGRAT